MPKRILIPVLCTLLLGACQVRPQPRLQGAPLPAPSPPLEAPAPVRQAVPFTAAQAPSGVFGSFLDAVRNGDAAHAWELLSTGSRAELGPSAEEFASRAFAGLKVRFGLWEGYRVALDHLVDPNLAVVSITGRRTSQEIDAVAAALVHEKGHWRLALHNDRSIQVQSTGPDQVVLKAPKVKIPQAWLGSQAVNPVRKNDLVVMTLPPFPADPTATVLTVLTMDAQGATGALAFRVGLPTGP